VTDNTDVVDNREAGQFELPIEGQTAFLKYERGNGTLTLIHTEVPESLRGRGLGERLVVAALDAARREGRRTIAVCPFVRAYLRKHPLHEG
jgi:predicted GNAT family acetyltransferase